MSVDEIHLFKEQLSSTLLEETISDTILQKRKLYFGVPKLDRLIGDGIPSNSIIELYGSAGSGKTQMALQLVSTTLKTENDSKILFICTQERFSIDRLLSMLGPNFDSSVLDRLHIEYFLDSEVEMHFFKYSLQAMIQEFNYELIIYDGIASNIRSIENIFEKSDYINQIIASIRRVFLYFKVCVLITNQITDIPSDSESIKASALGLTLENNVNIKIYLEKTRNSSERCVSVKKSLFSSLSKEYFIITDVGLKGSEERDSGLFS